MKEYAIQFKTLGGNKWITISEYKTHPCKTEEKAREELEEREIDHPWNVYRIVSRTVTDWEEV